MLKHIFTLLLISLTSLSHSQGFSDIALTDYTNVHALIIGIADYEEAPKLNWADDDARLMYSVLTKIFPEHVQNFDTLINENATQLNIYNSIENMYRNTKKGDLVIFYFSGHGDVANDIIMGKQGFFLAQDASGSREYRGGGAIPFEYVNNLISKITENEAQVWMITDACKSGASSSNLDQKSTMETLNRGFESTTKFTSCNSTQQSYEYESLQQGAFTYYLVKGISGAADSSTDPGLLSAKELNYYLDEQVYNFTDGKQSPSVTAADIRLNILKTNEELAQLIKDLPENKSIGNALASRGAKGAGDDEEDSPNIQKFRELIRNNQLHSNPNYAYEVLSSNKLSASEKELEEMNLLLLNALLSRAQQNMNLFLSGKPILDKSENYVTTEKDLELSIQLLPKEHPLQNELKTRSAFFSALQLIENKNNIDKAEQILLKLSEADPNSAYINQGLALLYLRKSDKTHAEEQLNAASQKISTWTKPINSQAYINILSGNLEEAQKNIDKSEQLIKGQENSLLLKAHMHSANYELQYAQEAINELKSKNQSGISNSKLLELEGEINALRGRIKLAQKLYKSSLSENNENIELLQKLATLYKGDKDTISAIKYYNQILAIDPSNQIAQANVALLTNKTVLLNNSNIDLTDHEGILLAVQVLEENSNYHQAIELLIKAIEIADWNPELFYQLAKQQYNNGEEQNSIKSIQKALEISPYHFKSIRSLSYMYLHNKQYREAESLIKKYDPYFTSSAKYLSLSFQVYRQTGDRRDLYSILERAVQLDSLETEAYKGLYQFHIEENNFSQAKKEFDNLIRIGGGQQDSILFYNLIDAQVRKMINAHYFQGLKDGLQILLDIDEMNFEYSFFMALTLYMELDYEGASKQLRKFNNAIQSFTPAVQVEIYKLKGKIQLELGHADLAERLFSMGATQASPPSFTGLAMAQYEQKKPNWESNLRKAQDMEDWNEDALKRLSKMRKKAGISTPYGGTESNRRY